MISVYARAATIWTPGYDSLEAWLDGRADSSIEQPSCAFANSRLLRGTSLLARMLVEVAAAAGTVAQVDLAQTPSVFGSAFGEIQIAILQMEMWRTGDGIISPHRFKNSVHNTGAGVFSIATQNKEFTTAIAGGYPTLAMSLLEAFGLLVEGAPSVIVSVGEEPLPPPLDARGNYRALAAGFVLSREPRERSVQLSELRRVDRPVTFLAPGGFEENPCAPALRLAEAIARRNLGTAALTHRGDEHWAIELS